MASLTQITVVEADVLLLFLKCLSAGFCYEVLGPNISILAWTRMRDKVDQSKGLITAYHISRYQCIVLVGCFRVSNSFLKYPIYLIHLLSPNMHLHTHARTCHTIALVFALSW